MPCLRSPHYIFGVWPWVNSLLGATYLTFPWYLGQPPPLRPLCRCCRTHTFPRHFVAFVTQPTVHLTLLYCHATASPPPLLPRYSLLPHWTSPSIFSVVWHRDTLLTCLCYCYASFLHKLRPTYVFSWCSSPLVKPTIVLHPHHPFIACPLIWFTQPWSLG